MHTSQQSSEVVATAAVADSDASEVGAAGTASAIPVLVFVLAAVAVTSVVDPRGCRDSVCAPTEWLTARRNYRRDKRRCRIVTNKI